ncbi:MAG TPA: aminopeptidase [Actinomycetota bacterium]|nr:aminopeptidase [Actinomycetota bacterium]
MSDISRAVRTVLVDCLKVGAGENVLVVTDPKRRPIGDALVAAARELEAEAVLAEMAERVTHGTEPPPAIASAMLACDVLLAPTTKSVSHTAARRAASERGARAATMPEVTEDMLVRTMSADYAEVKRRSEAAAELLTKGSSVTITSSIGTDLTISIEGRDGIADTGDLSAPGAFGNLPAGEGFIAPVEGRTNGTLVVDGTVWPVGRLRSPITITIEDGYAIDMTGAEAERFREVLAPHGREAFAVAELGIGTNEAATLTGNVLEDEKILGSVHVAFGDNHSFGGSVRVSSHQDAILTAPTLRIDGATVVEDGVFLL